MKKRFGFLPAGLQRKTVLLIFLMFVITVAVFVLLSVYQNNMLFGIVAQTRTEQQTAISKTSQDTMHEVMKSTLADTTVLRAEMADNDFSEIMDDAYMLQAIAQNLLAGKERITPKEVLPPDPSLDGKPSAMVLYEEGVDYTQSEYLGIIGHMSDTMIAMMDNSEKIASCYIGLSDGTHLSIDTHTLNRFDENGNQIPYPVRQRPWYKGAVETGGLYFTGIEKDAFGDDVFITCSIPIFYQEEIVGVAGIDIKLTGVSDFINASSTNDSVAFIVNDKGQVALAPEDNGLFMMVTSQYAVDLRESGNQELADLVRKALVGTTDLTMLTINGREYYAAGSSMPSVGWAVIILVDKEVTEQPEKLMLTEYDKINEDASAYFQERTARVNRAAWLAIVVLLIINVCLGLIGSGRIVRPLEAMTKSIIDSGKTGEPFEMKDVYRTNDEIEVLAEAYDDLSQKTRQYINDITVITAENERINTELTLATHIQANMLPNTFPAFPDREEFTIYATMDPAKEVGGDFYDFFMVDEDHLAMVIADVSGKGVPAALFMMTSRTMLKDAALSGLDPAGVLWQVNAQLSENNKDMMFVTVWMGILEISTGKLTWADAGHNEPLFFQKGQWYFGKKKCGTALGAFGPEILELEDDPVFVNTEVQLEDGDMIFQYTDGVNEAMTADREQLGNDRLVQILENAPSKDPEEMLPYIHEQVDAFVQGADQFDDITMLALRYRGKA